MGVYEMSNFHILACMSAMILLCCLPCKAVQEGISVNEHELARQILSNKDLTQVLSMAHDLIGTGMRAGEGYREVWIRDLNTIIELALDVQKQDDVKQALLMFFHFQGEDGNIVDGYVDKARANVSYKYISSKTMPDYLAHKNTVETDQETSLIQAVHKYVLKTSNRSILAEKIQDVKVIDRLEMAMDFLMTHRFNEQYGLIWGATTMDWGDVQPEHQWGVEMDEESHPAIDVYDNAMFIMAISDFLDLAGPEFPKAGKWKAIESNLRQNTMKHLWDGERHKFIPHIYLDKGSSWPENFDENRIYYHGGSTAAMQADLLSKEQISLVLNDMVNNMRFAGAATIGITNWPAYPKGFFKNKSMAPYSYQNSGDWTWWGGRTIQELVRHGFVEEAYREILPMVERVRKNKGFYEWYTVTNEPRGSGSFRGSAGTLGKAIIMLQKWAEGHQK
jgi:hypothetical protein